MTHDLKSHVLSEDLPPLINGMNQEGLVEMLTLLGFASTYGYDPEVDFR
jgi:hypothetical protein